MKNTINIAITGGIASGKSQVLAYLRKKGHPVISCDEINATLLNDQEYIDKLSQIFPSCVFEGKIDKRKLADCIFSSYEKRKALENIAHPEILKKLFAWLSNQSQTSFAEVPLLFENNLQDKFDKIVVLMRAPADVIHAVVERDACTDDQANQKVESQFSYWKAFKESYFSDEKYYLIFNDGSLESLQQKVDEFLQSITQS